MEVIVIAKKKKRTLKNAGRAWRKKSKRYRKNNSWTAFAVKFMKG